MQTSSLAQDRSRARPGEWEDTYFRALERGFTKASAAAIAGVSERAPYKRATEDSEFAERERVSYNKGTAALEGVALKRVTDPKNPSDSVLKHLLAVRGVHPRLAIEHAAPDPAPNPQTIPLDEVPYWIKLALLTVLDGGVISKELEKRALAELDTAVVDVTPQPDQRKPVRRIVRVPGAY